MDHAVRVHKEITKPTARKKSNARLITLGVMCTALVGLSAYSWLARPAFIWGTPAAPLPTIEQEAGLRMTMYFAAQRVEAYRKSAGTLPSSLTAIGEGIPGVTYAIVGDGVFEMRGTANGKSVVLRSDQSPDEFLGNSGNVIQGLGRP
jgi:hypothetical protein